MSTSTIAILCEYRSSNTIYWHLKNGGEARFDISEESFRTLYIQFGSLESLTIKHVPELPRGDQRLYLTTFIIHTTQFQR